MHAGHNAGRALTCEATHARHLQAHGGHLEEDDEDDDQQDEDDDDDDDEDNDDEFATPHQGVVIEELEDGPAPAAVRTESRKQDMKRGMQVQLPLHQGRVIEELEDGPTPAAVRKLARRCTAPGAARGSCSARACACAVSQLQVRERFELNCGFDGL